MNNKTLNFEILEEEILKDILKKSKIGPIETDVFLKTFPLVESENEEEKHFDTAKQVIEFLNNHNINSEEHYKYVFTCVDGDSGDLILINGWHFCNRLFYVVSTKSWSTGDKDKDSEVYIETMY